MGYSHFNHLHNSAREPMMGAASDEEARERKFLASDEFREIIMAINDERNEAGHDARVALSLAMLDRVALNPRDIKGILANLQEGYVALHFFGVVSPVPNFYVPVGSAEQRRLIEAVERNVNGRLMRAAHAVRRMREDRRAALTRNRENVIWDCLRNSLSWPAHPRHANSDPLAAASSQQMAEYRQAYEACVARLNNKIAHLRDVRQRRLALLSGAACAGGLNWTELCLDLAREVLLPLLEAKSGDAQAIG